MKKLYLALFLAMVIALSAFVFADSDEYTRILSYSVDGYAGDETRLFSPTIQPAEDFTNSICRRSYGPLAARLKISDSEITMISLWDAYT